MSDLALAASPSPIRPPVEGVEVVFQKGQLSLPKTLPKGVCIQSVTDGLQIEVDEGVVLDKPLLLIHRQDEPDLHVQLLILIKPKAKISLMEIFEASGTYLTQVQLGEEAALTYCKVVYSQGITTHLHQLTVQQQALSTLQTHMLTFGGQQVRTHLAVQLLGQAATACLYGIAMPRPNEVHDNQVDVEHLALACQSKQDYKNIVQAKTKAVFKGKIRVAKGADQTQAEQSNKTLMLAPKQGDLAFDAGTVETAPQLEIFADDVRCTHGATVGCLDNAGLFYLATRGIDYHTACSYMTDAFVADSIKHLSNKALIDWVKTLIHQNVED